ncbi:MAG: cytochrome C oxidase subunit IV family protein, partial [Rhodococcus sp. (in: high G+C Gram-positive bacteria)]
MSDTSLSAAPSLSTAASTHHASPAGGHDIRLMRHRFLMVYAVLVFGTLLTVAMYYVHFDKVWQTVSVALVIAAAKSACVAAVFMHLWHGERD